MAHEHNKSNFQLPPFPEMHPCKTRQWNCLAKKPKRILEAVTEQPLSYPVLCFQGVLGRDPPQQHYLKAEVFFGISLGKNTAKSTWGLTCCTTYRKQENNSLGFFWSFSINRLATQKWALPASLLHATLWFSMSQNKISLWTDTRKYP